MAGAGPVRSARQLADGAVDIAFCMVDIGILSKFAVGVAIWLTIAIAAFWP
jgi:hypothetical protein